MMNLQTIKEYIAILAGLLSHIGVKDPEKNDYQGSRNARFHIFPASGYLKTAQMIMSMSWSKPPNYGVESLQNSAGVDRALAKHLIKRSYSKYPLVQKRSAVMAYEKVSCTDYLLGEKACQLQQHRCYVKS